MVYLDYSATTPVNDEVLNTFIKVTNEYSGNFNSLHKLGTLNKQLVLKANTQIKTLLKIDNHEIIYTSGASESNNLAIKGIIESYPSRGKHVITTKLEHSSIIEPLKYLETKGYKIDYVSVDSNGLINMDHFRSLINDETILVSIASVSSELGLLQPIKEINNIILKYPRCFFHCDMTQSIGKIDIDTSDIDLISFSAHKFYGLKGIGCLIKKSQILLTPIIHGGDSISVYRSGTPNVALIVSMAKALRISIINLENNYNHVCKLNKILKKYLSKIDHVVINSTDNSIPHIINFSIKNIKPETLLHALEEKEIYISTKSACSSNHNISEAVMAISNDYSIASSSLRVSISYLTKVEEIEVFKNELEMIIKRLVFK